MMRNTFLQLEYFNLNSLESPKRPRFLVLSVIRAYENWRLSRKLEVKVDNLTISLMRRLVTQLLFNLQHEGTQIVCTVSTYHPISQFTKTSLFLWKMIAVLLKLDDKYKPAKKTVQKQLSVTSMSAATGLWHLTGELPGAFKKSHTFS